jgi:tryptophan synthase beta chain
MVGVSYRQKPQRPRIVELFGGEIHESPSPLTKTGRDAMQRDPDRIGSLAVATGEAIEMARELKDSARFADGSGETCVLLHQTEIGNEAVGQMQALGDFPVYVVACMGAGCNFAGVGMPFLRAARAMGRQTELVAAEPVACPKLTRGDYLFDINDFSGTTPVTRMYTARQPFLAPGIHAGGLRYHGTSAFLSALYAHKGFRPAPSRRPGARRRHPLRRLRGHHPGAGRRTPSPPRSTSPASTRGPRHPRSSSTSAATACLTSPATRSQEGHARQRPARTRR